MVHKELVLQTHNACTHNFDSIIQYTSYTVAVANHDRDTVAVHMHACESESDNTIISITSIPLSTVNV